jgi:type II secretory pathway predicted ATPase ExeA
VEKLRRSLTADSAAPVESITIMAKLITLGSISSYPEPGKRESASREVRTAEEGGVAEILFQRIGVQENPFGFTPNPKYLYPSRSHAEARASMILGLECGLGFQALIAPPGMGKTTVLFDILAYFRRVAHTAFLFQLQGNARSFLRYLALELGTEVNDLDLVHVQQGINRLLVRERRLGRRTIIVIDEGQTLNSSVLEVVRLLSNFETASDKLLQIVLAGQPELAEKLALPGLAQLSQRISMIKTLTALNLSETIGYIEHRLGVAGYQGQPLFTPAALESIWAASRGVPREINTICFNALLLLTATAGTQVGAEIVREVLHDLQPASETTRPVMVGGSSSFSSDESLNKGSRGTSSFASTRAAFHPYFRFYNFKQAPFETSPSPSVLCFTSTHSAALARLYSGLAQGERVMLLTGRPGVGKSLVSLCLADILMTAKMSPECVSGGHLRAADLSHFSSQCSEPAAQNLGIKATQAQHPADCGAPQGRILLIDEAEDLCLDSWKEIQFLTASPLRNPQLQIVLIGRLQVEQIVQQETLRELLDRIRGHCYRLQMLDEEEASKYITWRIGLARENGPSSAVFTNEALVAIARHSCGIPRMINFLCETALVRGYELSQRPIPSAIIHEAAEKYSRDKSLLDRDLADPEEQSRELLNATTALVDFHTALKGARGDSGRRRCDGRKHSDRIREA